MARTVMVTAASLPSPSRFSNVPADLDLKDVDLDVEIEGVNPLNLGIQGLGQKVHPWIHDEVQKSEEFESPKRHILGLDNEEITVKHKIEVLEQKVRGLMFEKGVNQDKSKKFGNKREIEECKGLNEKEIQQTVFNVILGEGKSSNGFEETEKQEEFEALKDISRQAVEIEVDIARFQVNPVQLVSKKKELAAKLKRLKGMLDELDWSDADFENEMKGGSASDELSTCDLEAEVEGREMDVEEVGESRVRRLCNEIELLELMLSRVTIGMLDSEILKGEVGALKGSEEAVREMKVKMVEFHDGLWELKRSILELTGKKTKELIGWIKKEEQKLETDGEEGVKCSKLNWGAIATSIGAIIVATAVVFMRHGKEKAKVESGNKNRTG
ncbi:hypothetical protein SLA2020_258970 [Shorea laevis]